MVAEQLWLTSADSIAQLQQHAHTFRDWYAAQALRLCDPSGTQFKQASAKGVIDFTKAYDRGEATPLMTACQEIAFNIRCLETADTDYYCDGSATDALDFAPSEQRALEELAYFIRTYYKPTLRLNAVDFH